MRWSWMLVVVACHDASHGSVAAPDACRRATIETVRIDVCEQHCKADSPPACGTAAQKYSRGIGVKKDVKKGLELGVRGCELGDADGCETAELTYTGIYDVPGATFEDHDAEAKVARRQMDLRERDCDATDGDACLQLSWEYEKDWYIPIRIVADPKKAAALKQRSGRLYQQACDGGDGYACSKLASGTEGARLDELLRRACALGYAPSCTLAGLGELGSDAGSY